jgi:hypothetical protein
VRHLGIGGKDSNRTIEPRRRPARTHIHFNSAFDWAVKYPDPAAPYGWSTSSLTPMSMDRLWNRSITLST